MLSLATVVALRWNPPDPAVGKTTLAWAVDNNPVRQEQVDLIKKLNPDLFVVIDPTATDNQKIIVQCLGGVRPDLFSNYGAQTLKMFGGGTQ